MLLSPDIWRHVCEASFDAVFLVDRQGFVLFANQTLGTTVNRSPNELVQKNINELFYELKKEHETEDDLLHHSSMAGLIRKGLVKSQSLHLMGDDTNLVPVLLSTSPIDLDGNGHAGVLCIAKDMRAERQREKKILEIQERLNHSVMESMAEIAGGIAHEINNPLAVITGRLRQISRALSETAPDLASIQSSIQNMQTHATRIAFVVSSLKTLCRNASSDMQSQCDVADLINDVIGLFQDRATEENIRIEKNFLADSIILVRQVQLKQALFQIMSNAISAASQYPAPWIRVESSQSSDNFIEISVTDCGTGIAEPLREKIFHPFFSTRDTGKGQGIGLPTARAIIDSHGGTLLLDSHSVNTRFVIRLPSINQASSPIDPGIKKAS